MEHQPKEGAYEDPEHRTVQRRLALHGETAGSERAGLQGRGVGVDGGRGGCGHDGSAIGGTREQDDSTGDAAPDRRQLCARRQPERAATRRDGKDGGQAELGELLQSWKIEQAVFGVLLVLFAIVMSLAQIFARHPDKLNQLLCAALRVFVDLHAWLFALGAGAWWTAC